MTTATPTRLRKRAIEGVITAVVAVTGVEDQVGDIIVPGALTAALAVRRPKVVFHHAWENFLGRSLHIEELMPGDARLPKRTKDGKAWPKEAGALVAVMQFNLNVQAGRDGYEWARFYTESNECEWSIGYKTTRSSTQSGIRYITALALFEFSLVLFGAASLSMTTDIKDLRGQRTGNPDLTYSLPGIGADLADGVVADLERKAAESMSDSGIMVALRPSPEVAAQLAVKNGTPAEHLHVTLAFLGSTETFGIGHEPLLVETVGRAVAGHGGLKGKVGGLGRFPKGDDGEPVYVPVDVPGLSKMRDTIVDAIKATPDLAEMVHENHGFTPHLTLGYDLGDMEPVEPVDVVFDSVHVVVGSAWNEIPLTEAAADRVAGAAVEDLEQKTLGNCHFCQRAATTKVHVAITGKTWPVCNGHRSKGTPAMPLLEKKAWSLAVDRPAAQAVLEAKGLQRPGAAAWAVLEAKAAPFDPSKHERTPKGEPGGGRFTFKKGDGYKSTGRQDKANDVKRAQASLIKAGHLGKHDGKNGNGADGLYGDRTTAAAKKWQKANGKAETGRLSAEEYRDLVGADPQGSESKRGRRADGGQLPERRRGRRMGSQQRARAKKPDKYGRVGAVERDRQGRTKDDSTYGQATGVGRNRRSRSGTVQTKSAWDTVMEAKGLQDGVEAKYDTSPIGSPGDKENWVDQVGGLPLYIRAVAHALIRGGRGESEAIQLAVGAMKRWAAGGDNVTAKTRAKAAKALAEWEAKKAKANSDGKSAYGDDMETKMMHGEMPGSYEALRESLNKQVDLRFRPKSSGDPQTVPGCWAYIEATFADHVIVSVEHDGKPGRTTYRIDYTIGKDGAPVLGEQTEVTLRVIAEDGAGSRDADEVETAAVRFVAPAAASLDDAAAALMVGALEAKGLDVLAEPLDRLLDALDAKGVDLRALVEERERTADDEDHETVDAEIADQSDVDDDDEDGEFLVDDGSDEDDELEEKAARTAADFEKCDRCGSTKVADLQGSKQPKCAECGFHLALKDGVEGKVLIDSDAVFAELAALRS